MPKLLMLILLAGLITGCASLNKGGFGPMERSLNRAPYGYKVVDDPTNIAPTEVVERFELRDGDCFSDGGHGWADCANDRERTELKQIGNNAYGSAAWYGWYMYVPESYENIHPVKVALGQFHQRSSKPAFMFQNHKGGLYIDRQLWGHTQDLEQVIKEEDLRGKWHRFEVHAKWSRDETGFFRLFVNGEERYSHEGRTSAKSTYFKYGIYRSFISRKRSDEELPTQVVYYTGVRKGPTRESIKVPEEN